jgi:hypothetical protein
MEHGRGVRSDPILKAEVVGRAAALAGRAVGELPLDVPEGAIPGHKGTDF